MINRHFLQMLMVAFILTSCSDDGSETSKPDLQLKQVLIGALSLDLSNSANNTDVPFDESIVATFSLGVDITSAEQEIDLKIKGGASVPVSLSLSNINKIVTIDPASSLSPNQTYELIFSDKLKGDSGENFPGATIEFITIAETLSITSVKIDGVEKLIENLITDIDWSPEIQITFSHPVDPAFASSTYVRILKENSNLPVTYVMSEGNTKLALTPILDLEHLTRHQLWLSGEIEGSNGETFTPFSRYFYTQVNPAPKFPVISDEDLLTLVQQQTFKYFWDFGHPASGLARERNTSGDVVTIGGSGFGVMALIVGIERGFITRAEGLSRLGTILNFLETCDRFHGAWPHWLNGNTGKIVPFSPTDDGGDLVETSFMIQGLITMRQYLDPNVTEENNLMQRINALAGAVEYDWYAKGENVLYWLWSPNNGYILKIQGHNETLITYFLAAGSPTHAISASAYTSGYSRNGAMLNGNSFYGFPLALGENYGGPLFFAHYSWLGLNPSNMSDQFANYWTQNTNHSLINHAYCVDNPKNFVGYSDECWGLTASDNQNSYSAHSPTNDLGVITPTAAVSSIPYTPVESMKALKFFYYTIGDKLWGPYGFYDAFNITAGWTASSYLAIDQGPIIIMIENYRTGLLWDLFMSAPEVQAAMTVLNFSN